MPESFTRPLRFTYSLWKFIGALHYLDKLDLVEDIKERIFRARSEDYGCFVDDLAKAFTSFANEFELHRAKRELREGMSRRWGTAVNDFFPALLNQGLVMSCTIFDSFLTDCFTALAPFAALFLTTEKDRNTELEKEGEGLNWDEINNVTKESLVSRFERCPVNEKIANLKKLRIDLDATINPKSAVSQALRLSDSSVSHLVLNIYGNRNDIVHRGALVLEAYDQLHVVYEIFGDLMLGIALKIKSQYGIPTDLDLIMRDPTQSDNLLG